MGLGKKKRKKVTVVEVIALLMECGSELKERADPRLDHGAHAIRHCSPA